MDHRHVVAVLCLSTMFIRDVHVHLLDDHANEASMSSNFSIIVNDISSSFVVIVNKDSGEEGLCESVCCLEFGRQQPFALISCLHETSACGLGFLRFYRHRVEQDTVASMYERILDVSFQPIL